MKFILFLITVFLLIPNHCDAVVKRHDVPPENYVLEKAPEYLIDMPHEGHGVLISPQWVVTVAHVIFYDYVGKNIKIGSKNYRIESVVKHPDYIEPDDSLFEGDAAPLMMFFKNRSDIALIKLSSPVSNVTPIKVYQKADEVGKKITVFGRGATGDGSSGENVETKSLRIMNSFQNVIDGAEGNWLTFKFNAAPNALPLEGIHGSGDSGGASIIYQEGVPFLVGLSSWQYWCGELASFKGGLYGTSAYQVRLSSYNDWILGVLDH